MPLNRLFDSGQPIQPPPDIQRTSFSLDAIARLVCNTWSEILAAQSGSQFDAVVIGSGMYGAYTAAKLFEFGKELPNPQPRILILEAGPFLLSEHFQNLTRLGNLFDTVLEPLVEPNSQGRKIDEPSNYVNATQLNNHHRCVGGKSLFWGGWTPRLTDADLQQWPADVVEYMRLKNQPDGYEYVEREIGTWPIADFINGDLFEFLKNRAKDVLSKVPSLTTVQDPPIAVLGQSPGSGLFSMDKFSSLPLLLDAIREASGQNDANRRLFLVPNAEVIKLETSNGVVTQIVVALKNPFEPNNKSQASVVRLDLKPSAAVVLAGNTVNSTRLALNSFPRPAALQPNSELIGRNLMVYVRGNFVWKVTRAALGVPSELEKQLQTAALHIPGSTQTEKGPGQFHFQFYAAPNMDTPGVWSKPVGRGSAQLAQKYGSVLKNF